VNQIVLRACEPDVKQRYADGLAMLADLMALQAGSAARSRRLWRLLGLAAVLLGLVWAGLWWRSRSAPPRAAAAAVARVVAAKAIAVLPFENMNDDKEDAFFADGIHEES